MIQFKTRKALVEDVPKLIRLFEETIYEVYDQVLPMDLLQPWIEGGRLCEDIDILLPYMFVAECDDDVVAVTARLDDKVALLWVHPAYHRNGIGGRLLDIIETEVLKSGYEVAKLDCFSKNDKAMRFYRAKGWEPISEEMDEVVGVLKTTFTKKLN